MWPDCRAQQLTERLSRLRSKATLSWTFAIGLRSQVLSYFSDDCENELRDLAGLDFCPVTGDLSTVDLIIVTAHGIDLAHFIWELRSKAPNSLVAVWLWDNHVVPLENLRTALAADFLMVSHWYAAGYLHNPCSPIAMHLPACSAQWSCREAASIFHEHKMVMRSDKLLVNYVDYPFSWRSDLFKNLQTQCPETDVLLMEPKERSRYFKKSKVERMNEWLSYKATLILPIDRDLSTRVFDGLLAGQVLVVPRMIQDFDTVIPPEMQAKLGIIRIDDFEIPTIREAAGQAVQTFNSRGDEGVYQRHQYVIENHMLINRLSSALNFLGQSGNQQLSVTFNKLPQPLPGLHIDHKSIHWRGLFWTIIREYLVLLKAKLLS